MSKKIVFKIFEIIALISLINSANAQSNPEKIQDTIDALKIKKDEVNAKYELEKAELTAQFAKEEVLKNIFGENSGQIGSISIEDDKKTTTMNSQATGAKVVKILAENICTNPRHEGKGLFFSAEKQIKLIVEANNLTNYIENSKTVLKKILGDDKSLISAASTLPVFINVAASISKLFLSDYSIRQNSNEGFISLFGDLITTSEKCKGITIQPNADEIKKRVGIVSIKFMADYYEAKELVKAAKLYLKKAGKSRTEKDNIIELAENTLSEFYKSNNAIDFIKKNDGLIYLIGMSNYIGKSSIITYKIEQQNMQISKTTTISGTILERASSAQLFYREINTSGEIISSGYIFASTPQEKINVKDGELISIN